MLHRFDGTIMNHFCTFNSYVLHLRTGIKKSTEVLNSTNGWGGSKGLIRSGDSVGTKRVNNTHTSLDSSVVEMLSGRP